MIVYWIGCIVSAVTAHLGMHMPKGQKPIGQGRRWMVIFFSALPLFLIAALRYEVGEDYFGYSRYFEALQDNRQSGYSMMEPLYHLLNVVVAALRGEYSWVVVISAVIFFAAVFPQIFRDSPYPALSIFLLVTMGYYFVFFNVMRQMIGCGLLLFSIRYIQERRPAPFFLFVALATGFHESCIIFAIMYWVGRIKIKPMVALALTALVVVLNELITGIILDAVSVTKYSVYFSSEFSDSTGDTAVVMLAINAVVLIFASICYKSDEKYQLYYNLQILALWVTIYSGKAAAMLRLLWMFGLPGMILIPLSVNGLLNERTKKIVTAVIVLLYTIYVSYTIGIQNSNSVLPYKTILARWV